ncbi:MAG: DUF6265 family protein [Planctomycetota bacterium]|nr:DUF6265 family protein [Planctomycetota bacterium]
MIAARSVSIVLVAAMTLFASGCKSSATTAERAGAAKAVANSTLPAAAKELQPLAFMTGHWTYPTPNGRLVNREHWMSPAGTSMVGAFQQIRRAGGVAFYEFSAITAEPREKDRPVVVTLFHRHLHTNLAIDERRKNVDVFTLESTGPNSATFVPAVDIPGGIKNMTYRLDGPDTLVQEINFKPDSKEKSFSTAYGREK